MNAAAKALARRAIEDDARRRKTLRLVDAAGLARDGRGFTADEVASFTDEQWAMLEEVAGTRPASVATRQLVVSSMRLRARRQRSTTADDVFAKLRGCDPADALFDGL